VQGAHQAPAWLRSGAQRTEVRASKSREGGAITADETTSRRFPPQTAPPVAFEHAQFGLLRASLVK